MASQSNEHILIVAKDERMRHQLVETLEAVGNYNTTESSNFEEALSEILLTNFDLIITEAELPDLSGMDLLAVVGGLRPDARVIVVDDDLSARSAVAVFRLGAVDYLYKPLNMSFVLMQVERQLTNRRQAMAAPQDARPNKQPKAPSRDRSQRLDPRTRPAALVLNREHFKRIELELSQLLNHVKANFVALVDTDGNMIGAAGSMEGYDLQILTQAINIDHRSQRTLADILEENKFHSTYFEGEENGVYIIEFGNNIIVSLAVICEHHVKPGMVWLYSKRTAAIIDDLLKTVPQPRTVPRLKSQGNG